VDSGMALIYARRKCRMINGKSFEIIPPGEKRSAIMSKIPNKKTSIEKLLGQHLRQSKIRYRSGQKLFGRPDFVICGYKIAVFCDGDFWHGYSFKKNSIKKNPSFWNAKIKRNMERDKEVNKELKKRGWVVIRFWEHDIKNTSGKCIERLLQKIKTITGKQ
jgi:DNA mismatch endonuclease Vsr